MIENIAFRIATLADLDTIIEVGDDLFDLPVKVDRATEFLTDPRHHLVIALDGNKTVGMASGFHYVHPDKDPVLFIDEVGVVDSHQGKGIGKRLVKFLSNHAKSLNCKEAWVLTDHSNTAAKRTYISAGGKESKESVTLFDFPI